jgi:hypothetical protein
MTAFLKHIGRVGDRKVAVVFRQIPGEEHMCLLVYTQLLNQNIHDPIMSAIESPSGQAAKDLGEQLNRSYTRDGKIILQVLHHEGMMKKINTDQVMMTPQPNTQIKLSELNKILNEMEQGEAAVRRLAEIDASRGLQDPADVARRMRGEQPSTDATMGVLADDSIAKNLLAQADRMAAEARGLIAESERLRGEAQLMMPKPEINTLTASTNQAAKKRGRPSKKAVVAG